MSGRKLSASFVVALTVVVLSLGGLRTAHAQDLNDSIDAELDSSTPTDSSPKAATAAPEKSADSLDDVELDLGDEKPTPETKTPTAEAKPESKKDTGEDLELDDPKVAEPAPVVETPEPKPEEPTAKTEPTPAKPEEPAPIEPAPTEPVVTEEPTPAPKAVKAEASSLFDPPNEKYEKRLHSMSRNYRPIADPHWDEIIGERKTELYPIQPGDTLWDISDTFFGDGGFWAKLWSQNGAIDNPHVIRKGKALRFAAGTESDAPAIGVMDLAANEGPADEVVSDRPMYRNEVEKEVTPAEVESGIVLETEEIIPAPELPPPAKRIPLLRELPKSFKEDHPLADEGYDYSGIKGAPAIRANEPPKIILNSFAVDQKFEAIGKIDEIDVAERYAGAGQHVIVRANREISIGARVTFIQYRDRPAGASGPIVDVEGVGTITGVVSESKLAYRALVTTTLAPVERGAVVIEEPPPTAIFSNDGSRGETQVTVIDGEYDNKRMLLGSGAVIYLNGGSRAGLRLNEILGVHANRETRKSSTRYTDATKPIATIKVVDVREHTATAIILSSFEEVRRGDLTGGDTPEDAPEMHVETADEATAWGADAVHSPDKK